jgi:predicted ATP-dependent endonuclease of OLD family
MAEKLIVKNFGPIRDAELDIKKTTVLIGPQGSGKSTLAKLIAIFSDKDSFNNIAFGGSSHYTNFGINDFYEKDKTLLNFQNESYLIEYKGETLNILLNERLDKLTKDKENWIGIENLAISFNNYIAFLKQIPKENPSIIRRTSVGGRMSAIMTTLKLPSAHYIPAERFLISVISGATWGLMSNNIALPKYVIDFGSQFELARINNSELVIDYLDILYKYDSGMDKVILRNNKEIKLSVSASGFQSIIPLKLVIENTFKNGLTNFIIEEPELNLFPITQKHLIKYLAEKCTQNKNNLLLTTHSPYVLSSLNLLVFAYQTAQKRPDLIKDIQAIVPQESWINPSEFAAYYVDEGTVRAIINPKTGLIAENELDEVSDMIGDEFDALKRIYLSKSYAGSN